MNGALEPGVTGAPRSQVYADGDAPMPAANPNP
jgi:hypothetical protein